MIDPVSLTPSPHSISLAKFFIVDDEPGVLSVLHSVKSGKYQCQLAANAAEVMAEKKSDNPCGPCTVSGSSTASRPAQTNNSYGDL